MDYYSPGHLVWLSGMVPKCQKFQKFKMKNFDKTPLNVEYRNKFRAISKGTFVLKFSMILSALYAAL